MIHTTQEAMLDEILDDPKELFVESKSKRFALYRVPGKRTVLMSGDFSGPKREQDADVHRFIRSRKK